MPTARNGASTRAPSAMSPHHTGSSPKTGVPYRSGGRNGIGGASIAIIAMPSSSGAVGRELAQEPQHLRGLVDRPEDRPAQHDRPDRVQVVLE